MACISGRGPSLGKSIHSLTQYLPPAGWIGGIACLEDHTGDAIPNDAAVFGQHARTENQGILISLISMFCVSTSKCWLTIKQAGRKVQATVVGIACSLSGRIPGWGQVRSVGDVRGSSPAWTSIRV